MVIGQIGQIGLIGMMGPISPIGPIRPIGPLATPVPPNANCGLGGLARFRKRRILERLISFRPVDRTWHIHADPGPQTARNWGDA